eukprot:4323898-Amphidinium_carterae.1
MSLVANHLLRAHLPPSMLEALAAYSKLKETIHNCYPNLDWYIELVLLAYLRSLLVSQEALCMGHQSYPSTNSHYAHHEHLSCCREVVVTKRRIDHSFTHVWQVTGKQNADLWTEDERMIKTMLISYVSQCWQLTAETWSYMFPIVPRSG